MATPPTLTDPGKTCPALGDCPFCAHRSPPGSRFCNQCGAALHLRPCPHCGALNDVTRVQSCSRCSAVLGDATPDAPPAETGLPPPPESPAEAGPAAALPVASARRWLPAAALALLAALAALAHLSQQRAPAAQQTTRSQAVSLPAAEVKASAPAEAATAAPPGAPVEAEAQAQAVAPAAARANARPPRPAPTAGTRPAPAPAGLPTALPPAPPAPPCTEAVIALGLCRLSSPPQSKPEPERSP